MTITEIITRLITAVTANANKLKEIADKLDQLEVGAGGGGGSASIEDYAVGKTYKRNALVVYNETVYRVLPTEYTSVDFDTDYRAGKLKLVGFESGIVTYGQEPTQEEVNALQKILLLLYITVQMIRIISHKILYERKKVSMWDEIYYYLETPFGNWMNNSISLVNLNNSR